MLGCRPKVFVSYRWKDDFSFAASLLRLQLPRRLWGLRVFQDVEGLRTGDPMRSALPQHIRRSAAVIVLIGPDWTPERLKDPKDWVRLELETALRMKKRICPVLVNGGALPGPDELPASLAPLAERLAHPLREEEVDSDVTRLARSLAGPVGRARLSCGLRVLSLFAVVGALAASIYQWVHRPPAPHVRVTPGPALMGPPEAPRTVRVPHPYAFKRTEVTQAEWQAVMGDQPAYFKDCGGDCPVERVSWYDALIYLNRASARDGLEPCYELRCSEEGGGPGTGCPPTASRECLGDFHCPEVSFVGFDCTGYRLPTEAEWVRAVRADEEGPLGHGINPAQAEIRGRYHAPALEPIAWYGGNSPAPYIRAHDCRGLPEKQMPGLSDCGPRKVATKRPNRWGVYDGLGNVWEWTHSVEGPEPAATPYDRGGGWYAEAADVRLSARTACDRRLRSIDLGFRWVRTLEP